MHDPFIIHIFLTESSIYFPSSLEAKNASAKSQGFNSKVNDVSWKGNARDEEDAGHFSELLKLTTTGCKERVFELPCRQHAHVSKEIKAQF